MAQKKKLYKKKELLSFRKCCTRVNFNAYIHSTHWSYLSNSEIFLTISLMAIISVLSSSFDFLSLSDLIPQSLANSLPPPTSPLGPVTGDGHTWNHGSASPPPCLLEFFVLGNVLGWVELGWCWFATISGGSRAMLLENILTNIMNTYILKFIYIVSLVR